MNIANPTMPSRLPIVWIDLLLFKASWAALVIFQSSAVIPVLGIIVLKIVTWPDIRRSVTFILRTACIGLAMDLLLVGTGVFVFPENYFPLWLVLLWFSFALTLPRGFSFIVRLHPLIQGLIGITGGCLGYYAGFLLGSVSFGYSIPLTLLIIAGLWGVFLPLVIWINANLLPEQA